MDWPELVLGAVGSGGAVQLLHWWSGRGKGRADTTAVQVDSLLKQMAALQLRNERLEAKQEQLEAKNERLEEKYDHLEQERSKFRQGLYSHQQWDLRAHRLLAASEPDYPLPPELYP